MEDTIRCLGSGRLIGHAGKSGRRVVSAFIATAFAQDTPEAASTQWRNVADQIRPKVPKLATLMDTAEQDVLAYPRKPALIIGVDMPLLARHFL